MVALVTTDRLYFPELKSSRLLIRIGLNLCKVVFSGSVRESKGIVQ